MRALLGVALCLASGCFVSADTVTIEVRDARSAILVAGERVFAVALDVDDSSKIIFPRALAGAEITVVPYPCALDSLGLTEGELVRATNGRALPSTQRRILRATIPSSGDAQLEILPTIPEQLSQLRVDSETIAAGCCPSNYLGEATIFFGDCQTGLCLPRISANDDRCELTIDPSPCDRPLDQLGTFSARFQPNGEVLFDPPPGAACNSVSARTGAAASLDCAAPFQCPVDLFLPAPAPLFQVRTATVIAGPRFNPDTAEIRYEHSLVGYLADLALFDRTAVVASFSGEILDRRGDLCSDLAPPVTLHLFDVETLEETGTATAPPCTVLLAGDPAGAFLSAAAERSPSGDSYNFIVSRHGSDGRIVHQSAPVNVRFTRDPTNYRMRPQALVASIMPPHAVYLATTSFYAQPNDPEETEPEKLIVFASSAGLEYQRELDLVDAINIERPRRVDVTAFAESPNAGKLAWAEAISDTVRWIDDLQAYAKISFDPGELHYHYGSAQLWVPSMSDVSGLFPVFYSDRSGRVLSLIPPYESRAGFASVSTWPEVPSLMIASGIWDFLPMDEAAPDPQKRAGVIALFDPQNRRFLPGQQRVGWGPIRKLTPDARGFVLGIAPWSGQLLRIEAAR